MSDFVAVESIKEALAECPICTEYFHDPSRIPRRMPCCSQAICEPCLETYIKGRQKLPCPLCRQQHHLPGGVKSLPKEVVVLRFLDVLKTKKDAVPMCTDCPDNNPAMAKCDNCSIYLCQPCLSAHARNRMSRNHKTITFENIAEARSTLSSKRVTHEKSQDASKLNQNHQNITKRLDELSSIVNHIDQSKKTASDAINKDFDDLIEELQRRRGILLSEIESTAVKDVKAVNRAIESHKTSQQKYQKAAKGQLSSGTQQSLLRESPEDVDYARRVINFLDLNLKEATSIIRATGMVRTITFFPTARPDYIAETSPCNIMTLDFSRYTQLTGVFLKELSLDGNLVERNCTLFDQVLVLRNKTIVCPHLEYDHSTSSADLITSGSIITNTGPEHHLTGTGCRLQRTRAVILSKPFVPREDHCWMFLLKINIKLKKVIPFSSVWLISPSVRLFDMNGTQEEGFTIQIGCSDVDEYRNKLCLFVKYDSEIIHSQPVMQNKKGATCELNVAVVLDSREEAIHVIDVENAELLNTLTDLKFDEPLWTMIVLGGPVGQEVKTEVVSGNKIHLSRDMMEVLNNL